MNEVTEIKVPCTVVGVNDVKTFKADGGKEIAFASVHVRFGKTLTKVKVSPENSSLLKDAEKLLDKPAVLTLEIFAGQGLVASLRGKALSPAK